MRIGPPTVGNIQVRLRRPEEVKELAVLSPDEGAQTLTPSSKEGALAFAVPTLKTYSVVVIR
ncbi:MAG: hypothetical protein ABSA59_23985 [Terriglobia bacterium]|jgi:hypothetical protein